MHYNVFKYKERHPEETMEYILEKLEEAGIGVVEEWTDSGISRCLSMRLCIEGTQVGTNGKGTTHNYARASGYAEFMERLQNNLLYTGSISPDFAKSNGFWMACDEIRLSALEMAEMDNPYIDRYLEAVSQLQDDRRLSRPEAIKKWSFGIPREAGCDLIALPFFSFTNRKEYYMPCTRASSGVFPAHMPLLPKTLLKIE